MADGHIYSFWLHQLALILELRAIELIIMQVGRLDAFIWVDALRSGPSFNGRVFALLIFRLAFYN